MTLKEVDSASIPVSWLPGAFRCHHAKVRETLGVLGFEYDGGTGRAVQVPLKTVIAAAQMIATGQRNDELTPSDQRNLAAAEKLKLETEILNGKMQPAEHSEAFAAGLAAWLTTVFKAERAIPNETKRRIFDGIDSRLKARLAELSGEA